MLVPVVVPTLVCDWVKNLSTCNHYLIWLYDREILSASESIQYHPNKGAYVATELNEYGQTEAEMELIKEKVERLKEMIEAKTGNKIVGVAILDLEEGNTNGIN